MTRMFKTIAAATAAAGTLDILSAFLWNGGKVVRVLNSVARGPFGDRFGGLAGAAIGLAVHFAIMTVMAAALVLAMSRVAALRRHAWIVGIGYGLILYGVMYGIVLPLRWPSAFPQTDPVDIAKALVSHILCVGLPLALIARRMLEGVRGPPSP